jgi:hypothetical protein
MKIETPRERLLKIDARIISALAVAELALSQLHIRMTRLSTMEAGGISLFAFIIFGLISVFAVNRMEDSRGGKLFAALTNGIAALAATWYLRLLFQDEVFFRNLYYVLNRQTREYDMLPLSARIAATIPLVFVIAGTALYYLSGLVILLAVLVPKKPAGETKRQ